ncbi:MAG: RNA-binding S4 domain-containing protein [Clostridia bacterium]|nr:RNA-binding S4 domain-containing protein [Clostridia bacterium]
MKPLDVSVSTEYIKLDSLLKYAGLCSTGNDTRYIASKTAQAARAEFLTYWKGNGNQ